MKMDLALIRWFVCLMAAVLVSACGDSDQAAQTQVVRKKLTAQADRSQPAPKAAPAHAAPADATVTAKAKPPEPVPTSPAPKPSEPPKPAEPPPPTHVAQTPAALVQPALAPDPTVLLAKTSAAPEVVAPLGSDPTPEKALFDLAYLSGGRSRLGSGVPELELPKRFRRSELEQWLSRISSPRGRERVAFRLERILRSASVVAGRRP